MRHVSSCRLHLPVDERTLRQLFDLTILLLDDRYGWGKLVDCCRFSAAYLRWLQ